MKPAKRSGEATPKRRLARDPESGKFEAGNPHTDPELLDNLMRTVRAVRDLEPMLSAVVLMFKQLGDDKSAALASTCGMYLSELKTAAISSLAADPESMAELKKKRLDAKRLGNVSLEEQQRIQRQAEEWKLEGVTPFRLAQSAPHVLQSLMAVAAATGIRYVDDDELQALADEVTEQKQIGGVADA